MRKEDKQLPILILTALGDEEDRVAGLKEGADDYLPKPFNLDEFLLRINGMLRRSEWYRPELDQAEPYCFADNRVDLQNLQAETSRGKINLTDLERRMLTTFFAAEGQTLSRSELRMRKYFEEDPAQPKHFLTVRGRGYRFVKTPAEEPSQGA